MVHSSGETQSFECRVCGHNGRATSYTVREMMYGSRESFEYTQCRECGCLQIAKIPIDLARHYPSNYYSQQARLEPKAKLGIAGWLTRAYCAAVTIRPNDPLTALMQHWIPEPGDFVEVRPYLTDSKLRTRFESILDVGCGASPHRLAAMRRCGFVSVQGVDPFVDKDLVYHGVPVRKCTLEEVEGTFGMVMFHHSLEHVPDPVQTLQSAARLLRPGGTCIVRVPVMGTFFWRHFGADWVEIDAPRHLHLLSLESMGKLASRTGFKVRRTYFDSEHWELLASAKYQRGIAQCEPTPADLQPSNELRQQQRDWIDQLNRLGDAGRACFTLERTTDEV